MRWKNTARPKSWARKITVRRCSTGSPRFCRVLDEILQNVQVENQLPLGLVEIPIKLVVGTKTTGRTAAFASNFMPCWI